MPFTAKFLKIHTISHFFGGDNNPICPQTSSYDSTMLQQLKSIQICSLGNLSTVREGHNLLNYIPT